MNQPPIETSSLALLQEVRSLLRSAIDSAGGKETKAEVSYLMWGAVHINRSVAGYCELRSCHQIYASKLLVRPVIETVFAVVAALNNPAFLLEQAHAEHRQDLNLVAEHEVIIGKMLPSSATDAERQELLKGCAADRLAIENAYADFVKAFSQLRPGVVLKRKKLKVQDAAEDARLEAWYGRYRTYCQFTHGALRAVTGGMDAATDTSDNLGLVWLVLILLDHLKKFAPVDLPDLKPFWNRANAFLT